MTDPVAFLEEAHKQAEQTAQAAAERAWSPHWEYDDLVREIRDLNNGNTLATIYTPEIGLFVGANDPASVLRRIAGERKMLAEHQPVRGASLPIHESCDAPTCDCYEYVATCGTCAPGLYYDADPKPYPCATVRLLAEGYGWTAEEEGSRNG